MSGVIHFSPFELDLAAELLRKGGEPTPLRPKTFAVLRFLAERPGQLVSKQDLLTSVWGDVAVTEDMPRICVRELRRALDDDPRAPRYIETVHRKGYRFIAAVEASDVHPAASPHASGVAKESRVFVGREEESFQIDSWFQAALTGKRQIALIAGEAGIGKTTLVNDLLSRFANADATPICTARGHCREAFGLGEPYMPVLELLGDIAGGPHGERLRRLLSRHSPTWLAQMPWLAADAEGEGSQQDLSTKTRPRMLREIAAFVEALSLEVPVVLVLEDLHWSDHATLDVVSALAERRGPARILLLGTLRPADAIVHGHPLTEVTRELERKQLCRRLDLDSLSRRAVNAYFEERFAGSDLPHDLVETVYEQSDGNPFFIVSLLDHFVAERRLVRENGRWSVQLEGAHPQEAVPEGLRGMIAKLLDTLPAEELELLEHASVIGVDFASQALAAASERDVEAAEDLCEALVNRQQLLRASGDAKWHDGSVGERYSFRHALYRQALYERVPEDTRRAAHRRVGLRLEAGYAERRSEIAANLAMHFERGGEYAKAVECLDEAAQSATRRLADREAARFLERALQLLPQLPKSAEQTRCELRLELARGVALAGSSGFAAPEADVAYERARELATEIGEDRSAFTALMGLRLSYGLRGLLRETHDLAARGRAIADESGDSKLQLDAHAALGFILYFLGDLSQSREHLNTGIGTYDRDKHSRLTRPYGLNLGVECNAYAGWTEWTLGYADEALEHTNHALTLAQELAHPTTLAFALTCAAWLHLFRREPEIAQAHAEAAMTLSEDAGLDYFLAGGIALRGWALADRGQVAEGLEDARRGGAAAAVDRQHVAASYARARIGLMLSQLERTEEALTFVDEGIREAQAMGSKVYEPELHRIRGEILVQATSSDEKAPGSVKEAEVCFERAATLSRDLNAKAWELRALCSLCRLAQRTGRRRKRVRQRLAETLGWFTQGLETADWQEAKALVDQLE